MALRVAHDLIIIILNRLLRVMPHCLLPSRGGFPAVEQLLLYDELTQANFLRVHSCFSLLSILA